MLPKGASNPLSHYLNTSLSFSELLLGSVRCFCLFSSQVRSSVSFPSVFWISSNLSLCFPPPPFFKHDFNLQALKRTKKKLFEVFYCLLLGLNHLLIKEQDQSVVAGGITIKIAAFPLALILQLFEWPNDSSTHILPCADFCS